MKHEDILDDFSLKPKVRFSKWSFRLFLLSFLCFVFIGIEHKYMTGNIPEILSMVCGLLFCISTSIGIIKAIQSVKHKEKLSTAKVVGLLGNTFFMCGVIWLFYYLLSDISEYF